MSEQSCALIAERWFAAARRLGLQYDAECELTVRDAQNDIASGCGIEDEDLIIGCESECQVYFGDGRLGDACEVAGRGMSTCAQGLVCGADDRCHEPCDAALEIAAGHACGYAAGFLRETCVPGTICHGDPGTCMVPVARGASCADPESSACGPEDHCVSATMTCAPKLAEGEACVTYGDCSTNACDGVCLPPQPFVCNSFIW